METFIIHIVAIFVAVIIGVTFKTLADRNKKVAAVREKTQRIVAPLIKGVIDAMFLFLAGVLFLCSTQDNAAVGPTQQKWLAALGAFVLVTTLVAIYFHFFRRKR